CRAITSTIEYNWLSRAKSYVGDLMTDDDYANNPVGSLAQAMTLRGNVINQGTTQANDSQIFAVYNDEASGSPVTFQMTALYNTLVGAGGDAAFVHLSNADGTTMSAELDNNLVYGTSVATLIEDTSKATLTGSNNWLQTGAAINGLTGTVFGTDPGFNDAASLDFVPLATSSCVGAANATVSGLPVDEYYENEVVTRMYRVRATANDIGAFEHDTTGGGIGPYGDAGGITVVGDGGSTGGGDGGTINGGGDSGGGPISAGDDGGIGLGEDGGIGSGSGSGGGSGSSSGGNGADSDGGVAGTGSTSSGCSCHAGATTAMAGGGGAWLLGLIGLLHRRRRSRST
ncbi:MAG: MYXO-CTERM sorting domain-containing protein, partial [Polyangiaceae bacterium]